MDRTTFVHQLRQSGLLAEQALDEALARIPESGSAESVARALVRQGLLTRFQARQILAGKAKRLTLGHYRILDLLGRGGAGTVYKAVHGVMNRVVALKVILRKMLKEERAVEMFRREVLAAAQLHHPNIVTAYDANEDKGVHYLVMECVEGPSLQGLVKERGPLPVGLACEVIRQAALALQYAHEKGMVHRDIKPANILLARLPDLAPGKEGPETTVQPPVVKVADFGLARLSGVGGPGVKETISGASGIVWGTIDFISPEQANDVHDVDIRSDLYSLGCTFYYALTGQVPFPGNTAVETLLKHLMNKPRPVEALRPDVPPAVAAIVHRLLAKDRAERLQTPAELVEQLTPWCGLETWPMASTPPAESPAPEPLAAASPPLERPEWAADSPSAEATVSAYSTAEEIHTDELTPFQLETAPIDPAVRDKWRQWTALIEVSVRQRGARQWVKIEAFQKLQRELVDICQDQVRISEGRRQQLFREMEELVRPWLKPEILMHTDQEIHFSLLELCRRAEREMEQWVADNRTTKGGQSFLGGILARFKGRKQRADFEAEMRNVYGVEL